MMVHDDLDCWKQSLCWSWTLLQSRNSWVSCFLPAVSREGWAPLFNYSRVYLAGWFVPGKAFAVLNFFTYFLTLFPGFRYCSHNLFPVHVDYSVFFAVITLWSRNSSIVPCWAPAWIKKLVNWMKLKPSKCVLSNLSFTKKCFFFWFHICQIFWQKLSPIIGP